MRIIRERPSSTPGPADRFIGSVWIDEIAIAPEPARLRAFSVHFPPGARTAWHSHPHGQALHVMEGVGRVQREGGTIQAIRAGDTIQSDPNESHWHGSAPDHFMTHLALQEADEHGLDAAWGEHVSDEDYQATPEAH